MSTASSKPRRIVRMTSYDHLAYARGFLLTDREPVNVPGHWTQTRIGNWDFHYDPATPIAINGDTLMFGHAVDLAAATSDLNTITAKIEGSSGEILQQYLDQLAGRYLVLRWDGNQILIQQDATGLRAVYYTEAMYRFVAGSHQFLVSSQVDAPKGYFGGGFLRENHMQTHPGRKTQNVGIVRQLPNTELSNLTRRTERIFPRVALEHCTVDEAAHAIIEASNIQLDAIKTPLMSSLSAGLDSRVTLALLRNGLDRTKFFTYQVMNRPRNAGNRHDADGAIDLASRFGLDHEMLFVASPKDTDFDAMMNKNTTFSHARSVAKAYYDHLPNEALHVRSNLFEIGRCYYRNMGIHPKKVSAHSMRYILANGKSFDLPTFDAFEEYVHMTDFNAAMALGYDGLDLFYWEHRMGSWMTPILHESDIAHDTHVLINARSVLVKLLGVPLKDRMTGAAFRRVIALAWPELAEIPVNGKIISVS
jgi:hypothetical protein